MEKNQFLSQILFFSDQLKIYTAHWIEGVHSEYANSSLIKKVFSELWVIEEWEKFAQKIIKS